MFDLPSIWETTPPHSLPSKQQLASKGHPPAAPAAGARRVAAKRSAAPQPPANAGRGSGPPYSTGSLANSRQIDPAVGAIQGPRAPNNSLNGGLQGNPRISRIQWRLCGGGCLNPTVSATGRSTTLQPYCLTLGCSGGFWDSFGIGALSCLLGKNHILKPNSCPSWRIRRKGGVDRLWLHVRLQAEGWNMRDCIWALL